MERKGDQGKEQPAGKAKGKRGEDSGKGKATGKGKAKEGTTKGTGKVKGQEEGRSRENGVTIPGAAFSVLAR